MPGFWRRISAKHPQWRGGHDHEMQQTAVPHDGGGGRGHGSPPARTAPAPRPSRSASATPCRPPAPTRWAPASRRPRTTRCGRSRSTRKGGLAVKGEGRRPIEFVTIDDRSEIETAVRFYEKLATDDKVDLLLPPWGSAMNFAIAPVASKYGYPMIGPTAISGKFKELALPVLLHDARAARAADAGGGRAAQGPASDQGKIKKVAVAYVNDLFGIELNAATGPAFKAAGLEVVDTKSYPLGAKDLSPGAQGLQGRGRRLLRRAHLSARQHPGHHPGQGGGLEPGRLLHRGGHGVPVLPRPLQGRGGRDGHRGLEPEGEVRGRARSTSTRT